MEQSDLKPIQIELYFEFQIPETKNGISKPLWIQLAVVTAGAFNQALLLYIVIVLRRPNGGGGHTSTNLVFLY